LILFGVRLSINTLYFSISIGLFVFFNTWNQTIIPSLNLLAYRKAFVSFTIVSVLLYLAFSVAFILLIDATAYWWLLGQISGLAIGFILSLNYMIRKPLKDQYKARFKLEFQGIHNVIQFAFPLSISTLMLWVLGSSYKLIIEGQIDAEALAFIGLALTLATSLAGAVESLLMQVFHLPFYKSLFESSSIEARTVVFQKFINGTIPIIAGALFVLISLSSFLLTLLAESRFASIYQFLMLGLLIEFLRVSTNIISHAAHSEYQTKKNIIPYLIGALIAFTGVLFSVQNAYWQYWVIVSLFLGWAMTLFLMVSSAKKIIPFTFPIKHIANTIFYLLPIPLLSWLFWKSSDDLVFSVYFIILIGLYTAFVLYRKYSRGYE
jgi:O-antigen/teichoic acid export membrane protein